MKRQDPTDVNTGATLERTKTTTETQGQDQGLGPRSVSSGPQHVSGPSTTPGPLYRIWIREGGTRVHSSFSF